MEKFSWNSDFEQTSFQATHFGFVLFFLKELQPSFDFGFFLMATPVPIPKPHFKLGQFRVLVP
jgi:hypothetical protein